MPQKYTLYEYDLELANTDLSATATDLLKIVKTYPDDFEMTSMSPSQFETLANKIKTEDSLKFNKSIVRVTNLPILI